MKKEALLKNLFFIVTLISLKFLVDFIYQEFNQESMENLEKIQQDYDPSVLNSPDDKLSNCADNPDLMKCMELENNKIELYEKESFNYFSNNDGQVSQNLKFIIKEDKIIIDRQEDYIMEKCVSNFFKKIFLDKKLEIYFSEDIKINHYLVCSGNGNIYAYYNNNISLEELKDIIKKSTF